MPSGGGRAAKVAARRAGESTNLGVVLRLRRLRRRGLGRPKRVAHLASLQRLRRRRDHGARQTPARRSRGAQSVCVRKHVPADLVVCELLLNLGERHHPRRRVRVLAQPRTYSDSVPRPTLARIRSPRTAREATLPLALAHAPLRRCAGRCRRAFAATCTQALPPPLPPLHPQAPASARSRRMRDTRRSQLPAGSAPCGLATRVGDTPPPACLT